MDDGLATGVTAKAAVVTIRKFNPKKIILAVPICADQAIDSFRKNNVSVVCAFQRYDLSSVGHFYKDFHQASDEEVIRLLQRCSDNRGLRQLTIPLL